MFNHADTDLQITKDDRVAQMVIEKINTAPLLLVPDGMELDDTERGEGGFGSTGK